MEGNSLKTIGYVLVALCIGAVLLCGCTSTGPSASTQNATSTDNPIKQVNSGSGDVLTVTGSTTVLPIAAKAAEVFMKENPNVDVQVNGGGSGVGVQSAGEGTAMIGMSSRGLKDEEKTKYPDLQEKQIAIDGIAIITNPSNPIPSLTLEQLKAIYNGNITNWKEVGGQDSNIIVIGRDSASGTREFFQEKVMNKGDFVKTQLEKNSNGAVQQSVAQTPQAIGYVGLGYVDTSVHDVPIDVNGKLITPSVETVKSGDYPISRPLLFLTKGEPTGLAKEFLSYITSSEGQKTVTEEGFIPL